MLTNVIMPALEPAANGGAMGVGARLSVDVTPKGRPPHQTFHLGIGRLDKSRP